MTTGKLIVTGVAVSIVFAVVVAVVFFSPADMPERAVPEQTSLFQFTPPHGFDEHSRSPRAESTPRGGSAHQSGGPSSNWTMYATPGGEAGIVVHVSPVSDSRMIDEGALGRREAALRENFERSLGQGAFHVRSREVSEVGGCRAGVIIFDVLFPARRRTMHIWFNTNEREYMIVFDGSCENEKATAYDRFLPSFMAALKTVSVTE